MTDPKTFTGPEGWKFTFRGDRAAGPHIVIAGPGVAAEHGLWIPLVDFEAFVTDRDTASAFVAVNPSAAAEQARRVANIETMLAPIVSCEACGGYTVQRFAVHMPGELREPIICGGCAERGIDQIRGAIITRREEHRGQHPACPACKTKPQPGVDPGAGPGPDEPWNHWCSKPCGAPGCKGEGNRT